MVTATPNSSKIVLDYGNHGNYSVTNLNPGADPEDLHKMAMSVAAFQEGTPKDVLSYVEMTLEKE